MYVLHRRSNNISTILEKKIPNRAVVSTLSGEIKNKRDFDTIDSFL